MSDRSPDSPERRALFLTLAALGAGVRPVLAAATGGAAQDCPVIPGDNRVGRPPIIIKGGSFYVEIDNKGSNFKGLDPTFFLEASPNMNINGLEVVVIGLNDDGIGFKTPAYKGDEVVLTITPAKGSADTVTLTAHPTKLTVTHSQSCSKGGTTLCLNLVNDGPPARTRRLTHTGFGTDVGFRVSRVDVNKIDSTTGTSTTVFTDETESVEYRLKLSLKES